MDVNTEKTKYFGLSAFFTSLVSTASAQGYSTGFGGAGAQQELVAMANEWIFYTFEASSVSDIVLFFVAPLFGFYMINKNMFAYGLESFEERIDRDSYARTDDELPTGLKGAALATSFITVQVLGFFSSMILLLAGGLAAIAWTMSQIGLMGDWNSGGSGSSGGDSGDSSEPPQDVMDRIDSLEDEISGGEDATSDAEDDIDQGNIDEAEDEIEQAMQAFSGAEKDILEILSVDTDKMDDALLKINNATHTVGELEKNDVATLKELFTELDNKVETLYSQLNDDFSASETDIAANFTQTWADVNNPTPLKQLVQRIKEESRLVAEGELSTDDDLRDALDEVVEAATDMVRVLKFEQRISGDLGELAQDEERLKKIARNSDANQNFIQRIINEEQQLQNLKDNLQKIDEYDAEHKVQTALSKLQDYLEVEQSEHEDIEDLYEKMVSDDDEIGVIKNTLSKAYDPHPAISTFEDDLNQIKGDLEGDIKDNMDKIETQIMVHGKHVSKAYQELQDLAN